MRGTFRSFLADDSAQDVVEYAYLALFVGLVGIVVWAAVVDLIGDRYDDYEQDVQDEWESPEPVLGP